MGDAFLRVWKPERRGTTKYAGRSEINRVEVVKDDEVIADLSGLVDVHIKDPLDGVSYLVIKTLNFELKIEPREEKPKTDFPLRLGKDAEG